MDHLANIERFQLRSRLGAGSFGVVFEAFDQERQVSVALKLLHEPHADTLYNFKQEFRALADIAHPNLVSPYELLSLDSQWFFTMELVKGMNIFHWLRGGDPGRTPTAKDPSETGSSSQLEISWEGEEELKSSIYSPPPSFEAVRPVLAQLAQGLSFLHQSGLLHRDLKPSNVLVTLEGQVKILDFGLASLQDESLVGGEPVAGTPAYMAPELLEGQPGTEASDWYSVGTMLYQILTGQLPHTGNPLEMAQAKLNYEPCPPSLLLPGVPVDLESLCLDLLQRNPANRPSGPQILERLGSASFSREIHSGIPPTLAGRAREISTLMDAFHQMRRGRMRIIHLHGTAGMGKSLLIRRFLREVNRVAPECQVFQGRCFEQESVPFKAMDSLVDALSRHLKHLDPNARDTIIPNNIASLVRLFPVLQPFASSNSHESESLDSVVVRQKAFNALREMLWQLAHLHPLILTIDDVHWGDKDSATLITALLSPPDPPPLMLLLTSADEGDASSPMITRIKDGGTLLPHFLEIHLRELPWPEARSLAMALLGPAAEAGVADQIAEESGGSPYLIAEMVRQLHTSGNSPTRDLKIYLHSQIESLPQTTRRILQILSLAACPLSIDILRTIIGNSDTIPQGLSLLRNYHLIRVIPSHKRRLLSVYHVQIREVALAEMNPADILETHLALANALQQYPDADSEALAIHFEGAGNPEKASEFATLAAERSITAMAFGKACDLYKKALALETSSSPRTQVLRLALAETLANAGFSAESGQAFMEAANAANAKESIFIKRRAAEEFLRAGHIESGVQCLRDVLHQVGESYPNNRFHAILQILYYRLRLKFRGYKYVVKDLQTISPEALEKLDLLWAAAMGLGVVDMIRGTAFHARMLLKALEAGEPLRIVRAMANESIFVAHTGTRTQEKTKRVLGKTQSLAEELGHPNSLGRALVANGITALLEGRWKACTTALDKGSAMLRDNCTGMVYEIQLAHHYSMVAKFAMGEFHDLSKRLPRLIKEAQERGDLLALTDLRTSTEVPLLLIQDHPELARRELTEAISQWTRLGFHSQHYLALAAGVNIELYMGNPFTSTALLEDNWPALRTSGLLQVQGIAITIYELHARAMLALALESKESRVQKRYLKSADGLISKLEREKTSYGNAMVLKLRALEALAEGQTLVAQGFLLQAEHAFEASDMTAHTMACRRARCILEGDSGWRTQEATELWMTNQGIQDPKRFTYMHIPAPAFK